MKLNSKGLRWIIWFCLGSNCNKIICHHLQFTK